MVLLLRIRQGRMTKASQSASVAKALLICCSSNGVKSYHGHMFGGCMRPLGQTLPSHFLTFRPSYWAVTDHVRGRWCTVRNRHAMEFLVDLSIRYGWAKAAWFAADGMARTPLIVDATSHLFGSRDRCTLHGDDRNNYDPNIVLGSKLLMDNSGVVICRAPRNPSVIKDELGRDHLPRPEPVDMCCTLRPAYEGEKCTAILGMTLKLRTCPSRRSNKSGVLDNVLNNVLD